MSHKIGKDKFQQGKPAHKPIYSHRVGPSTTRGGFEHTVVKGKKWRPPRIIENDDGSLTIHPLDNMKGGNSNKPMNTTGCVGVKIAYSIVRGLTIVRATGLPGRPRKGSSGKKTRGLYRSGHEADYDRQKNWTALQLRNKLLTLQLYGLWMGKVFLSQEAQLVLDGLEHFLLLNCKAEELEDIEKDDKNREKSTKGQVESDRFRFQPSKRLKQEIDQLVYCLRNNYQFVFTADVVNKRKKRAERLFDPQRRANKLLGIEKGRRRRRKRRGAISKWPQSSTSHLRKDEFPTKS